jgi:hypothetical protein
MELDITKSKRFVFSISIANVDITAVRGKFIIYLNNEMYIGFSTFIENGKLAVEIPPLDKFDFDTNKKYKAELWVIANRDFFTVPWVNEIIIKRPISIKTSIKEDKIDEPYIFVTKPIVIKG